MNLFIVLQTADIEIIGLNVFQDCMDAERCFDDLCDKNQVFEERNIAHELPGTYRIAGDDAYAVQLIKRQLNG